MTTETGEFLPELLFEGIELPPLTKCPSTVQLFLYSAVTRNGHRIHYDQNFARSEAHADVLVQGPMQGSFLAQLITDWVGDRGTLKKLSYSNRGNAMPGEELTCRGKVTRLWEENGERMVECEVRVENVRGDVLTPGTAVFAVRRVKE